MKKMIRANQEVQTDDEIARTTLKHKIQFDHNVIWNLQFYEHMSDLVAETEVYILAKSYSDAIEDSKILCKAWGYDPDSCVVQYAYEPINMWNSLETYECDGVVYGL